MLLQSPSPPSNDAPSFFSGNGVVTTNLGAGSSEFVQSSAIQADGKILVAGYTNAAGNNDFAVARYNADGSLDAGFGGGDGIVTVAIGANDDVAQSIQILPSGKILVTGYSFGTAYDIALVQLNSDGTLDTSFGGGDGIATSGISGSDQGYGARVQSDGKIIVGGRDNNNFLLARFNSDGSLDTTFDGDGFTTTDFAAGTDQNWAMELQADGKIVLAGGAFSGTSFDFGVVRYNADGSLDTTFNGTGKVLTDLGTNSADIASSLAIQPDGKIVVAGWSDAGGTTDFAVVRYNVDGSLDTTFSGDGKLVQAIGTGGDLGLGVAVQSDGKILVSGQSSSPDNNFALVRFNADGTLDTSFGGGDGILETNFGSNSDDRAQSIVVQSDGKIVLTGTSTVDGNYDFAIARYDSNGTLDTRLNLADTLGGTVSYTENGSAVVLDSNVVIFDAELSAADNFSGATLTLARNGGTNAQDVFSASGTLSVLSQGGSLVVNGTTIGTVTTNSNGTLLLAFNGNATQTLVNSAMRQIAYSNISDTPPASVQINWTFNDGNSGAQGSGGALMANGFTTVAITAVDDAPVVTTSGATLAYTENATATAVDPGLTVIDGDSATLTGATIIVSANYANGQDVLGFTDQLGIVGSWNAGAGVLTLAGTTTLSNYQTALRSVTYQNTSDAPDTATRTVSFIVNDGVSNSSAATRDIAVTAVNDAPVITAPATESVAEEMPLVFSVANGNAIVISDVDAGGGLVSVSINITNGTATLASTAGVNTVSGDGTGNISLYGTLASINNALDGLSFVGVVDYDETARIVVYVNDFGNSGPGFVMLDDSHTIDVTITPVNDAPVAAADAYTVAEDGTLTVAAPGVLANDRDPDSTDPAFAFEFGSAGALNGEFANPNGMAFDAAGNLYVADTNNSRIQVFNSAGTHLLSFGASGTADGQFDRPSDVAVDSNGNIYVADNDNARIQKFDSAGNHLLTWGTNGTGVGQFQKPVSLAVDAANNVYVVDAWNNNVQKFDSVGNHQLSWGGFGSADGQFSTPLSIAVDANGIVWVGESGGERIQQFDTSGNHLLTFGSGGANVGKLNDPAAIAFR